MQSRTKSISLFVNLIATVFYAIALVPSVVLLWPTILIAGAPDFATNVPLMMTFAGAAGLPLSLVVSILAGWILFGCAKYRAATYLMLLPLIFLALFLFGSHLAAAS